MFGAYIGDFVGSAYEFLDLKGNHLPLITKTSHFTDDTVLLAATMHALLNKESFESSYLEFGNRYSEAGYGNYFQAWLNDSSENLESFGNGAAMRVAPVAYVANTIEEVFQLADKSACCTHNTEEGLRGAQAVAVAVFMAKKGHNADEIKETITECFYRLDFDLDELHRSYEFSSKAEESVPQAIFIALESSSFEDCMRKGLYIGGDTDTILSIAGAIAENLHGDIPEELLLSTTRKIAINAPEILKTIEEFNSKYN